MIYRPQTVNFREVVQGDTFLITFTISDAYPLAGTRIIMIVRAAGDYPEDPVLIFDSETDDTTIIGQQVTFRKEPEEMNIRTGRFQHEIRFTTNEITNTLYQGLFEIVKPTQPA